MGLSTRYLRYLAAFSLLLATVADFVADAVFQAFFEGFDGPLAWYSSYTFGINKIVFAIALALILIVDFKLVLANPWGRFVRVACVCSGALSVFGLIYLLREHLFFHQSGQMSWAFLRSLLILYLFQLVFILVSVIVFRKTKSVEHLNSESGLPDHA